jgi:hypothetical protein
MGIIIVENRAKVEKLNAQNRMAPDGLVVYARRDPKRSGVYAFEREVAQFDVDAERAFQRNKKAWDFFSNTVAVLQAYRNRLRDQPKERRDAQVGSRGIDRALG